MTADGLIVRASRYGLTETADRLVAAATEHGMTVMARVDHAAGAAKVGLALRSTEVLMFGNPRAGTLLMELAQTIGIDLPLKALVWQDEAGQIWLGYNDPYWLAARHGVVGGDAVVQAMSDLLGVVVGAALAPDRSPT